MSKRSGGDGPSYGDDNLISVTVQIPESLVHRIEKFIFSPVSGVKSKKQVFEFALRSYLDREELIVSELEKVRERIERERRRGA